MMQRVSKSLAGRLVEKQELREELIFHTKPIESVHIFILHVLG